ncbi:hypothetical protein L916_10794 [Phytophthora nicotianae]|uniref:Uncharacterized protein n=1 Tax=Phytophthora nicotianae TaxID=4792 RepID=W2ITU4_PHYNI|nr:hypothetical protein L916_10794 [Phytophthora nicotianae]
MAPVLEPPEEDSETAVIQHNAEAHRDAMILILCVFGKAIDQVAFLVSDNCSLNKRLAQDQSSPALTLSQPASKLSRTNRTLRAARRKRLTNVSCESPRTK